MDFCYLKKRRSIFSHSTVTTSLLQAKFVYQGSVARTNGKNIFDIAVEKFSKQKSYLKFDRQHHKFSNFVRIKAY